MTWQTFDIDELERPTFKVWKREELDQQLKQESKQRAALNRSVGQRRLKARRRAAHAR